MYNEQWSHKFLSNLFWEIVCSLIRLDRLGDLPTAGSCNDDQTVVVRCRLSTDFLKEWNLVIQGVEAYFTKYCCFLNYSIDTYRYK